MKSNKKIDNLIITLVLIFLFLPIFIIILFSFNTSELNIIFEGFTLKWYKELFNNKMLIDSIKNTFILAITSTIISTIIGTISAYALNKIDFKLKKIINELLYIPVVLPEIVLGISLLSIYTVLKLDLGMKTLILSHIAFSIPYVIINVKSALNNMNPNLELAASDLGANNIKTFFYVTLPTLVPGILSGAMLAFTLSLDDVVVSYFVSGPDSNTLPLQIYSMIKTGVNPSVNALITILLLIIFIILTASILINIKKMKRDMVR